MGLIGAPEGNTCYTLSRLKGIETISKFPKILITPTCYTLSRLKGIETISKFPKILITPTCYTLSRLKGIETFLSLLCQRRSGMYLLYTFPFEGNRNLGVVSSMFIATRSLLHTFPFEGNRNWICLRSVCWLGLLLHTFPFEGNRNIVTTCDFRNLASLAIYFLV